LLANKTKRIAYIRSLYPGSHHDSTLLQHCFPREHQWLQSLTGRLDLGFQGFAQLYQCGKVVIPIKKKRVAKGKSNELSDEQKQHNKLQAQERIVVEHSSGGMKRYRILSNTLRLKSTRLMDTLIGVCAGLWNFSLN
jgi:hypothetical protein